MLRTVWAALVAFASTVPSAIAVMVVGAVRGDSPAIERIIRFWARSILWGAGIELKTVGTELLDPNARYILVANHYSYFDIPCAFTALPTPIRFMAKVSLFSIPIFGQAIRRTGFIPIDRKNRRTAVKSFDMATERIRRGHAIMIFPEEGRSRERQMRPFQRGAFLLALKSELPVVPVAIDGTYDVFRAGAKRVTPGRVTVTVTPPIATAGLTLKDKERLADESRARIARILFGDAAANEPAPSPVEQSEDRPAAESADRA
ncbi:MAG TPA: lysophospholipid acyltransferase family protein [Thermoanaerobaculia bacterium]